MKNNNLSIFANFCIDTEERYLRMVDSSKSFQNANIKSWCVNIRGKLKSKAKDYLQKNIKQELKIFHNESQMGWVYDTQNLLNNLSTELIFIWVEDHICIKDVNIFNNIINEMYENKIDYLKYTFFHNKADIPKINYVNTNNTDNLHYFDLDIENYKKLENGFNQDKIKPNYLLALPCIISLNLFKKNLTISKEKDKYEKFLPFNFERTFYEIEILPFRNSLLKSELFASIDDDKDIPGSSLIGRGIYKKRENRNKMLDWRNKFHGYYSKQNIFKKIFNFIKTKIK